MMNVVSQIKFSPDNSELTKRTKIMITATDLKANFEDIKTLVLQGKAMEAFEKYYGDDVVMQENETPATVGKQPIALENWTSFLK
jgi:hypothetical protein